MAHNDENAKTNSEGQSPTRRMTLDERLNEIFTYHPPTHDQIIQYNAIREAAKYFTKVVILNSQPGADQSAAVRKIREAVMTANASIALNGLSF